MKIISVAEAKNILLNGGVVAVPTETVYGIAAIASDKIAIEKIFRIKNRPADNPLICHFYSFEQAKKYLESYPAYVNELKTAFSPGPLSYLLPLKNNSPLSAATLGRSDVIIRIPAHPLFLQLLKELDQPIAAPSANSSGKYSATSVSMVEKDLGDKIDGIIDGGNSVTGIESTIIDCRNQLQINIIRPGAIGEFEIHEVIKDKFPDVEIKSSDAKETTPGNKYRHYAPQTPLVKINLLNEIKNPGSLLITCDEEIINAEKYIQQLSIKTISLGSIRSPELIARHLYRTMFEMDSLKAKVAYLLIPYINDDTWRTAIMNRINKMTEKP